LVATHSPEIEISVTDTPWVLLKLKAMRMQVAFPMAGKNWGSRTEESIASSRSSMVIHPWLSGCKQLTVQMLGERAS